MLLDNQVGGFLESGMNLCIDFLVRESFMDVRDLLVVTKVCGCGLVKSAKTSISFWKDNLRGKY